MCTGLRGPGARVSAHKNANTARVPYAPPTRPRATKSRGFPPINRHGLEKTGEAGKSGGPALPRTALTRLSVHRKGHRNEEAERHRGGAARQAKLCGARQRPALHLGARKRQGLRAAPLQGSPQASTSTPLLAQPPCSPSTEMPFRGVGSRLLLPSPNSHTGLLQKVFAEH